MKATRIKIGDEVVHRGCVKLRVPPGRGVVRGVSPFVWTDGPWIVSVETPSPIGRAEPVQIDIAEDDCIPAAIYDATHPSPRPNIADLDLAQREADPARRRMHEGLRAIFGPAPDPADEQAGRPATTASTTSADLGSEGGEREGAAAGPSLRVGDRVRCNCGLTCSFDDMTIARIVGERIWMKSGADDPDAWWLASSLTIVDPTPAPSSSPVVGVRVPGEFRVGDRVVVGANHNFCPHGEGVIVEGHPTPRHWRVLFSSYAKDDPIGLPLADDADMRTWIAREESMSLATPATPPAPIDPRLADAIARFQPGARVRSLVWGNTDVVSVEPHYEHGAMIRHSEPGMWSRAEFCTRID